MACFAPQVFDRLKDKAMPGYRNVWDDITKELKGHGLVESNWHFSGDEQSPQLEECLWEALVLLNFKSRGYGVERTQIGNKTNLDGKITALNAPAFFVECCVISQGNEESPAHPSKSPGKRESQRLGIQGIGATLNTLHLSGIDEVSEYASRKQLRFTNAFVEKHKQVTTFFGSNEIEASFLFLNSYALGSNISRLPTKHMPTSIPSNCVNSLFGGDGVTKIQYDIKNRTATGVLDFNPEIKKLTSSGNHAIVNRTGFTGDSLKNISGIAHCIRQPSQLAILYLTDKHRFFSELKETTELIISPCAEKSLSLAPFFESAISVSYLDSALNFVAFSV
jgi:hypothetical protein